MSLSVSKELAGESFPAGWYETAVTGRRIGSNGQGVLTAPGDAGNGNIVLGTTNARQSVLAYYNGETNDEVILLANDDVIARFDNLTVKRWNGKHAKAVSTVVAASSEVMNNRPGITLLSKYAHLGANECASFVDADLLGWTAVFAVRRTVASFTGWMTLLGFGNTSSGTLQLNVEFQSDGAIRVQHTLNGSTFAGRQTAASALPNATDAIVVVSGRSGQGYRVYVNGVRKDTTNIGTGLGITPHGLTNWLTGGTARIGIGARPQAFATSDGGPTLYRFAYFNDRDYYANEHAVYKLSKRFEIDYGIGV